VTAPDKCKACKQARFGKSRDFESVLCTIWNDFALTKKGTLSLQQLPRVNFESNERGVSVGSTRHETDPRDGAR
jgi:hypothetical protein